ncbi:MAG: hypothetical protein ACJA0E_001040 [Bermanella sp.]
MLSDSGKVIIKVITKVIVLRADAESLNLSCIDNNKFGIK